MNQLFLLTKTDNAISNYSLYCTFQMDITTEYRKSLIGKLTWM